MLSSLLLIPFLLGETVTAAVISPRTSHASEDVIPAASSLWADAKVV
jgi:hypothetical protein